MVAVAVAEEVEAGAIVIGRGRGVAVPTVVIGETIGGGGGGVPVIPVIPVGVHRLRGDGVGRGVRPHDEVGTGV